MNMKVALALALALAGAFQAFGWMEAWAPVLKSEPVEVAPMPAEEKSRFVKAFAKDEGLEEGIDALRAQYSQGGIADLNGDGIADYIVIVPWMGNGLNASGADIHFIISAGGAGNWVETTIEGYGAELDDIVGIGGKILFRHSAFHGEFEKSDHNHWVYQLFSFGADGKMKRANGDAAGQFPAVTIFYEKPRFKQIELTKADLKEIAEGSGTVPRVWNFPVEPDLK